MSYPTFTLGGTAYAIVPREVLAELGAVRSTPAQRRRKALAARLRAAREHAGLTQAELAEALGKSQPMVANVEAGRVRVGERYLALVLEACDLPEGWTGA